MTAKELKEAVTEIMCCHCRTKKEPGLWRVQTTTATITDEELRRIKERLGVTGLVGVCTDGENLVLLFPI